MKAMLSTLCDGEILTIGAYATIAKYTDLGAIFVRMEGSGLISPDFVCSVKGIKEALVWLDTQCGY